MVDAPITASVSDPKPAPSPERATGTVVAGRYEVSRAAELCALLRERPPVFPTTPGDASRQPA